MWLIEKERHDSPKKIDLAMAGCLSWEPQELPAPVGYVCALTDPDGNVVEFSFDQGVFEKVREVWGKQAE